MRESLSGVVLAGGTGSRLYPLTKVTNKHLLPVGQYPMIYHPLMRLRETGITRVAVVTSPEHMGDVVNLLGSGSGLGLDLTYRVQDEPGGIAQALGLCENFARGHPFLVVLGDNILGNSIAHEVNQFQNQKEGARILLKEVPDPDQYGVPRFRGDQIVEIIEKPSSPPSQYAVTGLYFYDSQVFDFISSLSPSRRGEYEVSDLNSAYVQQSMLTYGILDGWWGDAGTLDGWHQANHLARHLTYPALEGQASASP
ncbi:MAG: sugar phosphate nucleotidyltransferase [Bacteroidetes bacterium]|nr:sugar phosphate nucleotidyltransferase [Bacteroidota bacterium]MCY4224218.1 sugar phosphate nucleotidyltransferase [Bacteroidota bacterium]